MLSVTDFPIRTSAPRASAELWIIRVGGLLLVVMALLTFNTTSTTRDRVNKQDQQIDALYDALQREQQAKVEQGEIPITPPADELRQNPSLIAKISKP